jgi:uncharacterized protein (TIGR02145 family)
MTQNRALTANFDRITNSTLTIERSPSVSGSTVRVNDILYTVPIVHETWTPIGITASSAGTAYNFVDWTVLSGTATFANARAASTTVTLRTDATIRANFGFYLTINRNTSISVLGGSVTPSSGLIHNAYTPINITATPASGYGFINWVVTNGSATFGNANDANTTVTLSSHATIQANFERLPLTPGSQFNPDIAYGSFTDSRDGQVYRTVTIGTQTWMAENLNFNASGSVCYGQDSQFWDIESQIWITLSSSEIQANCNLYGRLYDWATIMGLPSTCNSTSCASQVQTRHRGICPVGWHVPSDADWTTLINFVSTDGAGANAGTRLRSAIGWMGADHFGFSALPGGGRWAGGSFNGVGGWGGWWSATEGAASGAWDRGMSWNGSDVLRDWYGKTFQFSLRCLQD